MNVILKRFNLLFLVSFLILTGCEKGGDYQKPYGDEPLTSTKVVVKDDSKPLKKYPRVFIPGKETLAEDEMRISALGTGLLAPSREQGDPSWLVELGNGEVFIFDAGGGSFANFLALEIPQNKANKIFLTHLHLDHVSDVDIYFDTGMAFGRLEPIHVYGPAGPTEDLGINSFVKHLQRVAAWHIASKECCLDNRAMKLIPHEFKTTKETQLVYDKNGVKIYAYAVPHAMEGAVGYRLEYKGLSFSYGGDAEASMQTVNNSKGVDVLVHETMNTPTVLTENFGWSDKQAKTVLWLKHTPPEAAGMVFSMAKPKLAVSYHNYVTDETVPRITKAVRTEYDGPFVLAQDLTVINVTPAQINVRQAKVKKRPLPVVDMEYIAEKTKTRKTGLTGIGEYDMPQWLKDSLIKIDFVEQFKKELMNK